MINPIMKIYEAEEALRYFKVFAPKVVRTTDKDLIPVNNGIFDYKNKKLLDFDPKYAFLSKSRVDFNKNAKLVNFKTSDGSYWNVEDWFKSLSNNKEMRELLWQITSAVIRPYVSWNKALIFYSFYDNNGKSVFCKLLENLSGKESYINLKIRNFNSDFLLNRLLSVNSIICDDNDFDIYLDKSETFNSLVNKKPIKITIYNKKPKTIVFKGLIVQGFNNLPKFKNGDDSMYNKFLPVLFDEYFEKSYIKDDFINSKEVLEYVLYKALMSDFYEFIIPKSSNKLLYEICGLNNLVKNFLNEMLNECVWDLLPNDFLYKLYQAWFLENISDKSEYLSKNKFLKEVRDLLSSSKEYKFLENNVRFETHCKNPEPLIYKYDIKSWMNKNCKANDINSICFPNLKGKRFKDVLRVKKRT